MSSPATTIDERVSEARAAYIEGKRRLAADGLSRALGVTPAIEPASLGLYTETNGRIYFTTQLENKRFRVAVGDGDSSFTEFWVSAGKDTERFTDLRDLPLAEQRLKEKVLLMNLVMGGVAFFVLLILVCSIVS